MNAAKIVAMVVAVIVGTIAGCSANDVHLGTTRQAIYVVEGEQAATPGDVTGEPHAAWVNTASRGAAWVVGVNSSNGKSITGFGRATDTPSGTLPPWTYCNFTPGNGLTGCGPAAAAVPMFCLPGPSPACGISGGKTQKSWLGDPTVVTTRLDDGFVGYVSLARSTGFTGSGADEVVISMSNDGGLSFTATDWVNVAGPDSCDYGTQDQPHAYIDRLTENDPTPPALGRPSIWVVWRHNGAGSYGGCIRGGFINTGTPSIQWTDSGHSVANMQHSFGYGIGGVMIGAIPVAPGVPERVTIVYSNTDNILGLNCPNGNCQQCCPTSAPWPTQSIEWYSVSTDDGGVTWNNSVSIRHTDSYNECAANGTVANAGLRSFGYVPEPLIGDEYVAVQPTQSTIELYRSTDLGHTWSAGPVRVFGGVSSVGSAIFPALNTDGRDRIAIYFYTTDQPTDTLITPQFAAARAASLNDWDPITTLGHGFCAEPPVVGINCTPFSCSNNACNNVYPNQATRNLGDYMEMGAKIRTGEFDLSYLPAWSAYSRNECVTQLRNVQQVLATRVSMD